jgi:hypothetical protein
MKHSWYHCGRCGSLFESGLGMDVERVCAECERIPSTGVAPADEGRRTESDKELPAFGKKGDSLSEVGQKAVRKRRRVNMLRRIVAIWAALMIVAVWVRMDRTRSNAAGKNSEKKLDDLAEGTLADERVAVLNQALPQCHKALAGFLAGGTPETRNQYVADPIHTAGKMAIFYARNPFPRVDAKGLRRVGQEPVRVGDEWRIETRWKGEDGLEFDAVFQRDGGAWVLDWDHFSRYSDYPWTLFLSGEGPEEGEFRLLARRVTGGDQAEEGGSRLRFVMSAPEFGKPSGAGMESPEFVIDRRSDEGLLLGAAFDSRKSDKSLFGSSLDPMEPDGFIRVRVRVKRGEFGGGRSFDLEEVVACHWVESDAVGYDLKKLQDDLLWSR